MPEPRSEQDLSQCKIANALTEKLSDGIPLFDLREDDRFSELYIAANI